MSAVPFGADLSLVWPCVYPCGWPWQGRRFSFRRLAMLPRSQHSSSPVRSQSLRLSTALAGAAGIALALLLGSSPAQARDVNWSMGVSVPGVVVSGGNGYPVYAPAPRYYAAPQGYYAPPPVYYAPPPVYYQPRPVYVAPPPVYYAPPPRPIYYGPPAPAYRPYYGPGWRGQRQGHRHHGHGRHDD